MNASQEKHDMKLYAAEAVCVVAFEARHALTLFFRSLLSPTCMHAVSYTVTSSPKTSCSHRMDTSFSRISGCRGQVKTRTPISTALA